MRQRTRTMAPQRTNARRALLAAGLLTLGACSSVSHRDDVAALVADVQRANLEATLDDLAALGPRPLSDGAATAATLDYLEAELTALGFTVERRTYARELAGQVVARVRPAGDLTAEFTTRVIPREQALGALPAVADELRAQGLEVRGFLMVDNGEATTIDIVNLLATKAGRDPERGVVELSAHYDTVPDCPGADDNSSGVAALLEVARVVRAAPLAADLRLCFFGAEEVGLWGSAHHAADVLGADTRVEALINLDSIGFTAPTASAANFPEGIPWYLPIPDEGNFVLVVGSFWQGWLGNLFEDAADTYDTGLVYYSANRIGAWFDDARRSDHAHYWDADVPAVLVTDSGNFRSEHYHQPSDTIATLDFDFITAVTRTTVAAAAHLTDMEPAPQPAEAP